MERTRTQVAIIGAGPAGLLLAHLLDREGIETVVLERHDRAHVESRIRAGVLEHGTVEVLRAAGVGERLEREGLVHHGIELSVRGERHRIDLTGLSGGRSITVYGQHEVVKDLIAVRLARGLDLRFEVMDVRPAGLGTGHPKVAFRHQGREHELSCDFIAGCDGFHGVSRDSIPARALTACERTWPFAWLGILAEAPPVAEELIYARSERGFALFSMRSPSLSRLYVQCAADDPLDHWPDERIWSELQARLGPGHALRRGPILQKGITTMRSFVVEPMRFGRLFLAGDAAHIVPPTGAKGMNLAVADVRVLAGALAGFYRAGRRDLLDAYSASCLRRVWQVQRFSWWMTSMLHRFPGDDPFQDRIQLAELDYLLGSDAAKRSLAENYTGLPFA